MLAVGPARLAAGSAGGVPWVAAGGIVGRFSVVACSRGLGSVSLVGFVTVWLLECDGIGSRHRARGAEAQGGDSKLFEHATPERLEASALRRRQVFR
jgi:hypothetical protein